jgi:hypothetical protein
MSTIGLSPSVRVWVRRLPLILVAAVTLFYAVGMGLAHCIDDDLGYGPGVTAPDQSRAVAIAARLIIREVDEHKWVANDPIFRPSALLDNMPAYQQGMLAGISRFAGTLSGVVGMDPELERAAGLLKYPGTVWKFDPRTSWAPTASAEKQYRAAARNLAIFNERLSAGDARFDRTGDALRTLLIHAIADLGIAADALDAHLGERRSVLLDGHADDLFYTTKGRLYGHALLTRELGQDFSAELTRRNLNDAWSALLVSLDQAAALDPLVVFSGAGDATFLPSHLTSQGYHLLQARAKMAAIAAKLG